MTSDRPTVIFLHPSDELYGADRQLLALVDASRPIVEPVVLLPSDYAYEGKLSAELRRRGVIVETGPMPVLRRGYLRPRRLPSWLLSAVRGWAWVLLRSRRHHASAIVSNSSSVAVGPTAAAVLRVPHLWLVRELIESPAWFRLVIRVNARLARGAILAISSAVASWIGPVPGRGPDVLYDRVEAQADLPPLGNVPQAVFVGRLNEWKGWEVFVEAARISHQGVPDARFVLAGGTAPHGVITDEAVRRRVHEADPTGSWLVWLGEVDEPRRVMESAWVVAVPSVRPEPLGNVVLEAMNLGRAVVGADTGGIPEMIEEGVTGRLVTPGDATSLADAMAGLLSDRVLAERYGIAGLQRARADFSPEAFETAWTNTLRRALPDM